VSKAEGESDHDEQSTPQRPLRFGLVGAAGYVAPKHLRAIRDTGHDLVAAVDRHDSVGVLDEFFPRTRFFTEIERFDRFLEKLRRDPDSQGVDYLSVCSPNYLHDAHVRLALRVRAHAICEKPLVISPWNLQALRALEDEFGSRVYTVLQLRYLPSLLDLRRRLADQPRAERAEVVLTYVSRRGPWYGVSWKSSPEKSGGLLMNLGIHFFDVLQWLFGATQEVVVHLDQPTRAAGALELEGARVRWFLSVDEDDLPPATRAAGRTAHRVLSVDGQEVDLSPGFTDLHTRVYEEILAGRGLGIEDARPSVEIVHRLRHTAPAPTDERRHPGLTD
jgi:UDP-N-acetyl-2-amino-2-deoxyglucuronate dehydrogenase